MYDGFIKVGAVSPKCKVADPSYNAGEVIRALKTCYEENAKIIVFPENVITGYTCNDLYLQDSLLQGTLVSLEQIKNATKGEDALVFVGLPLAVNGKLYSVSAVLSDGKILALIPKTFLPNYAEFYEARYFTKGPAVVTYIDLLCGGVLEKNIPFGSKLILRCLNHPELMVAAEICEDLWVPNAPSTNHALAGASIIVNLSASDALVGKENYRKELVTFTSAKNICAYIYASAGPSESTQDLVFSAHNMIAENGSMLADSKQFKDNILFAEVDYKRLIHDRLRMNTFESLDDHYVYVDFNLDDVETKLTRTFAPKPFVPSGIHELKERCEEILSIQTEGLKKRLAHTGAKCAVIGLSGGLDSTLAFLVTARAFQELNLPMKGLYAITMPCFGTTKRTRSNAEILANAYQVSFEEIDITDAVKQHFKDIKQDENTFDVTYENGQARERTQVLMNMANKLGGLVIGTGDMSELALGWATYNGDHMSMYGVNVGVPKTLVRHLVSYVAGETENEEEKKVLLDILDTPVSPELLPPKDGEIAQKTEELVGPYELHDYFLYYMMRYGYSPSKIYRIAVMTFEGIYDRETILKWLKTFFRRFFSQQFKRSCLPDGPKVGSVAVSPRGDLRMPSDASARLWMDELDKIG